MSDVKTIRRIRTEFCDKFVRTGELDAAMLAELRAFAISRRGLDPLCEELAGHSTVRGRPPRVEEIGALSLLAYSMGSDAFVRGVRAASTSNQPSLQRAARILSDPSDHVDGREDGNES